MISGNDVQIRQLLTTMRPITLEEMAGIRLMNRIDTKYVTSKARLVELLQRVQDEYFVQETSGVRTCPYLTTYLDTASHAFYLMHHNRRAERVKVRVRTYLTSDDLTFLEVKKKNNHGRTQKRRLQVDSIETCGQTDGVPQLVLEKAGVGLESLHPVVRNNFDRITLVNRAKTERLTIDFNVRFHNFETDNDRGTGDLVIIELKRDGNVYSPVRNILRDLHIHPTGFSKCCIGMALTDDSLKRNNFLPKLHLLEKMKN